MKMREAQMNMLVKPILVAVMAFPAMAAELVDVVENQKISPTDGEANEFFGGSVSLNDQYMAAAASRDDSAGLDAGSVYVYSNELDQSSTDWQKMQFITAPDASTNDRFGFAVVIANEGDNYYMAISAPYDDNANGLDAGSVYIYRLEDEEWNYETTLIADDGQTLDLLGTSLSAHKNTLLVGAEGESVATGAAYIFEYDDSSGWEQVQKLEPADGDNFDYFGRHVAMSQNLAAVGSPLHSSGSTDKGAVYVYKTDGDSTFILDEKITLSGGQSGDQFGRALSFVGPSTVMIGANRYDADGNTDSGAVFVYDDDSGWELSQVINPNDGQAYDQFGSYISANSSIAIIAARGNDTNAENAGISYVYELVEDTWEAKNRLRPSDATSNDFFGRPCLDDLNVLIGAEYDDVNGSDSGSIYYYALTAPCFRGNLDGSEENERYGTSVSSLGDIDNDGYDDFAVGAPFNDVGGSNAGTVDVISGKCSELLFQFVGENPDDQAGRVVGCAGDYNDDGVNDILIGAPRYNDQDNDDSGIVYVISGFDFATLAIYIGEESGERFGSAVSGGVDLTGDGIDDFIVGAPYNNSKQGTVYVIRGGDGEVVAALDGKESGDRFGHSLAVIKKLDGDGTGDFIVGAPYNDKIESKSGAVYAYSGGSYEKLYSVYGSTKGEQFGYAVASAGKVNDDSKYDFIAGSPKYNHPSNDDKKKIGLVSLISGKNGEVIWSLRGKKDNERFGSSVAGNADFDCDGMPDVLGGSPRFSSSSKPKSGRVYVRAGVDGSSLMKIKSSQEDAELGFAVSFLETDSDLAYALSGARKYSTSSLERAGRVERTEPLDCEAQSVSSEPDSLELVLEPGGKPIGKVPTTLRNLDLDHDGRVGATDFIHLLISWGSNDPTADLDNDGLVGHEDLTIFLIQF